MPNQPIHPQSLNPHSMTPQTMPHPQSYLGYSQSTAIYPPGYSSVSPYIPSTSPFPSPYRSPYRSPDRGALTFINPKKS